MIRVVATADNHLGRNYDRMLPRKLEARREYLRQGFNTAVDHAITWQAHLFVIAGDLFDTPDPRNIERTCMAKAITRLRNAGITVCAISGNHDMPRQSTEQGGIAPLDVYHTLGAITYFESATSIQSIVLDIEGTAIAIGGMSSNPLSAAGNDPLKTVKWHRTDSIAETSLLLLHGQVEGHAIPDLQGTLFPIRSLLEHTDADIIVMGDLHHPATIPLDTRRKVVIPGATERMTFGEPEDLPGFATLEYSREHGWQTQRITSASQPRSELTIQAEQLPATDIASYIISHIMAKSTPETLVRVILRGSISRDHYHHLALRTIQEKVFPHVFQCTFDTTGLMLEDQQGDSAMRGVRLSQQEEITQYADEKIADTNDSESRAIWQAAKERAIAVYHSRDRR